MTDGNTAFNGFKMTVVFPRKHRRIIHRFAEINVNHENVFHSYITVCDVVAVVCFEGWFKFTVCQQFFSKLEREKSVFYQSQGNTVEQASVTTS